MSKVKWCVSSGPDESHLINVDWFNKLKEAKGFSENLPVTPCGHKRPFKIQRFEFSKGLSFNAQVKEYKRADRRMK